MFGLIKRLFMKPQPSAAEIFYSQYGRGENCMIDFVWADRNFQNYKKTEGMRRFHCNPRD